MARHSVIVLGGSGLVGSRLVELWQAELDVNAPTHNELDVLDDRALATFLCNKPAEAVVNLAAWADVDGAEAERGNAAGRVFALNVAFPERLATLCGELHKHLLHVSTDYVFDGTNAARPYREDDTADALCWYAETKLLGEHAIQRSGAQASIARIEMPFTGRDYPKRDFARTIASRLQTNQPLSGVVDQRITPVFLDDAVRAFRRLVETRHTGVVHVAATDWTTPLRFARSIAKRLHLDADHVQPEYFESFATKRPARRPQNSWLDVSLFAKLYGEAILRPVEDELDAWVAQVLEVASPA